MNLKDDSARHLPTAGVLLALAGLAIALDQFLRGAQWFVGAALVFSGLLLAIVGIQKNRTRE